MVVTIFFEPRVFMLDSNRFRGSKYAVGVLNFYYLFYILFLKSTLNLQTNLLSLSYEELLSSKQVQLQIFWWKDMAIVR